MCVPLVLIDEESSIMVLFRVAIITIAEMIIIWTLIVWTSCELPVVASIFSSLVEWILSQIDKTIHLNELVIQVSQCAWYIPVFKSLLVDGEPEEWTLSVVTYEVITHGRVIRNSCRANGELPMEELLVDSDDLTCADLDVEVNWEVVHYLSLCLYTQSEFPHLVVNVAVGAVNVSMELHNWIDIIVDKVPRSIPVLSNLAIWIDPSLIDSPA